jgi:ParB family chromosome partitioning protein
LEAWEGRLRDHFGTQVRIAGGLAKGRVEIHYFSGEDLERILELAGVGSAL